MTVERNYAIAITTLGHGLLLKCSTVGIGFNRAETNCGIAHILGILLMNSCNTIIFLATTIICSLSGAIQSGVHFELRQIFNQ